MKANEVSLSRFLAQPDTQFVVPVYQRNYDWKRQQCRQLLDDILTVGSNKNRQTHFIGSIVYIHGDVFASAGIRELSIIDGQQRITTVMLIYIAIYRCAQGLKDEALQSRINETYLINKFANEEEKLKLKPAENNDKVLKYLLRSDPREVYSEYSQLIENYNYLQSRVIPGNLDIIRAGLDKLLFVEISLDKSTDDPQRIFESLNSTGLDLSQADLIRNYILMGLNRKEQSRIYKDFWQVIETVAVEERSNINRVSDFVRDFLTIENREIPNKNKVYEEFKNKYPIENFENIESILPKIRGFAYHYHRLINPSREPDKDIRDQIKLISRLEINVSYPFLLEVYDDYARGRIDKRTFIEILETVQSYVWRRFIIGLPTSALNKIFMRLHEDVDLSNYLASIQASLLRRKGNQRFPTNQEVFGMLKEKDLYNIKGKNRLYLLERLENYQNIEKISIEDNSSITVEHIFPQNPDPSWKAELGEQEYGLMKEKYLNTVANLTLSGNNGSLGNRSFREKRDMNTDGKEQGYKFSRLWLNRYLSSIEGWGLNALEERFQLIVERFQKVWKYPEVSIDQNYDYSEVNIFEAEDPTFRRLEYVVFYDQKLHITRVSELYVRVVRTLFEMRPDVFFTTDLSDRIALTKDRSKLRQATAIDETYFVESNLDNFAKFERIKYALTLFDAEDELSIKYAE
ncbi:DUF262 domain-containing protein [bacterium]|nr:DUF262 domain-containing protein [bacterium]